MAEQQQQSEPRAAPGPAFELSKLSLKDTDALLEIYNEDGTYQHMAQGNRWERNNAERFLRFCEEDEGCKLDARGSFYWAVRVSTELVGYVGVHTVKYNRAYERDGQRQFFATFVIRSSHRGKGLGPRALAQALDSFHALMPHVPAVFADLHEGNERSAAALKKAGFAFVLEPGRQSRLRVRVGKKFLLRLEKSFALGTSKHDAGKATAATAATAAVPESDSRQRKRAVDNQKDDDSDGGEAPRAKIPSVAPEHPHASLGLRGGGEASHEKAEFPAAAGEGTAGNAS